MFLLAHLPLGPVPFFVLAPTEGVILIPCRHHKPDGFLGSDGRVKKAV